MSTDKHPADVPDDAKLVHAMAEAFEAVHGDTIDLRPVGAMLRRIPALEAERDEARQTVRMAHELGTAIAAERDQLRAEVEALRADVWRFRHVLSVAVVALAGAAEDRPEFKRPYQIVSDALDAARKQQ